MTSGDFPFRLVRHDAPDGSAHLDLFIDVDREGELITYELQVEFLSEFRQRGRERHAPSSVSPLPGLPSGRPPWSHDEGGVANHGDSVMKSTGREEEDPKTSPTWVLEAQNDNIAEPPGPGEYQAVLKKPHRRKYWTHEGPISGNRGQIREMARGIIRGGPFQGEIKVRIARPE